MVKKNSNEAQKFSKLEMELLKEIKKRNLTDKEVKNLLSGFKNSVNLSAARSVKINKKTVKYGVISDTHMGSIYYDSKLLDDASKKFEEYNVDFVVHVGDICEGHYEGYRSGHVFELTHIGGDQQIEYAAKELSKITKNKHLYFITGNHENNTFYKLAGFEIGKTLEHKLENSTFLGNAEGEIQLPNNQKMLLLHPDGGSSYAISYRSQKIAESLEGGKKPAILHLGHYHKAEYIFYRNIHIIQSGTLQSQTKFMKGKHLSAHKGFYVVEADVAKEGIVRIKPEFFPEY